ncbi:MAG: hypothetical protein ACTFAL_12095 [Candidatus Electronema sp. V4]|uniref:hypothetical protein n=1 Tax=Candidatus Electronema sp. V4 TaxID=3454756 RepID=UPI00405560EA
MGWAAAISRGDGWQHRKNIVFISIILFLNIGNSEQMAYKKDSIVDYLKSKKQAADFRSRQHLWTMFDPREIYTGSFEQNKQLLESMRIG